MTSAKKHRTGVAIIGGGLAGIATALELLDANIPVALLDRDEESRFGGLARESFGGIFVVDSPQQRRLGIKDSPELALRDWLAFAEFGPEDEWPRRWAEQYVHRCRDDVYAWVRQKGVRFFPVVHWVERGLYTPGNSVPRFHMVWGTGYWLIQKLIQAIENHPNRQRLTLHFRHHVTQLMKNGGQITGCAGEVEPDGVPFEMEADAVVVASGGINGDLDLVRRHWFREWGDPPETILNGSHHFARGELHQLVEKLGGQVTHLDRMWNYAAGVHHPRPHPLRPHHGLSLVPPKSALWVNYRGERLGPPPLVSGYDTRYLVYQICRQPKKYSWQILNWKIACKELAISGAEFNDSIRERKWLPFLKHLVMGNPALVRYLIEHCPDFVVADTLVELVEKMNALTGTQDVDLATLERTITEYDDQIERGPKFFNDDQLRRIAHLRQYRGDRVRTCKFQKILDPRARPLIAIREFILSRKSLGGIQTDLQSRVLDREGNPISNLFAVGEAAGFGGGGIHGWRALEGTFLGNCILTGRVAAQAIVRG
ncbi:MAG: FAD-binding dehydrogenase [Calditrichaeota bacterium]|nr:FAD-binding dehydrogenase [Calditrichota bacterium]